MNILTNDEITINNQTFNLKIQKNEWLVEYLWAATANFAIINNIMDKVELDRNIQKVKLEIVRRMNKEN